VIYAASTERSVGLVLLALILVGWVAYIFINIRQAKGEIGSEIELAPNRAPLPSDEEFEGPKLERIQAWGVVFLAIIAVTLPVYWLREPGRQAGAIRGFAERSAARGEREFTEGFQCNACHGPEGVGGSAPAVLDLEMGGKTIKVQASYVAPSLNDIFYRFDTGIDGPDESTEVRNIITFGRPPIMPAWGLAGGGPGNEQQIQDVIDYLWSIQLTPEEMAAKVNNEIAAYSSDPANAGKSEGQVLYELNCARCHTPNWNARGSHEQPLGNVVVVEPGQPGAGGYGRPLNSVSLTEQFPDPVMQMDFIKKGAVENAPYGTHGIGNYGMPGFGDFLSDEQIMAIVEYERSLEQQPGVTTQAVAGAQDASDSGE